MFLEADDWLEYSLDNVFIESHNSLGSFQRAPIPN